MMLKITSESSTDRGRIMDDQNSFVMTNFVLITGAPTSPTSNYTKYIDLPKSSKYWLFNKCYGK